MFGVPTSESFPAPPTGGELIHTRGYEVRTYKMRDDMFILRGVVIDEKPAGLYIADDPEVLWVHHMVVDLEVSFPMFEIQKVSVTFHERPHTRCTDIEPDYQKLVGLSIARGFNNKVKELFGGPRAAPTLALSWPRWHPLRFRADGRCVSALHVPQKMRVACQQRNNANVPMPST